MNREARSHWDDYQANPSLQLTKEWLMGWLSDFITRQAEGKLHLFWAPMIEAWFRRWPEHTLLGLALPNDPSARPLTANELATLGTAIQARRRKLENWFRYQSKKIGNASGPTATASMRNIFKLSRTKKRRAHQPIEVFQKLHKDAITARLDSEGYNALNEATMAEEIDDWENEAEDTAAARLKRAKSERMRLRTRVVQAMWAEASEEERGAAEAEVAREKEAIRAEELAMEELDASVPRSRTPSEIQDGVDRIEPIFKEVHSATYSTAGWVGMSLLAGPNPRLGGEISLKLICFGETPAGNDFEDACVDFDKNVIETFEAFARSCFTLEERQARAFPARAEAPAAEGRLPRDIPIVEAPSQVKAPKPKRMTKKKKSPTVVPAASDDAAIPAAHTPISDANSSPAAVPFPEPPSFSAAAPFSDDSSTFFATSAFSDDTAVKANFGFDNSGSSDDDMNSEDPFGGAEATTPLQLWPAGMSPPSSPSSAAIVAMRERGGMPGGATMAIDPQLLVPSSPTPAQTRPLPRPRPRPANNNGKASTPPLVVTSAGALPPPATTTVGGFNFPLYGTPRDPASAGAPPTPTAAGSSDKYRMSELFGAFRGSPASAKTPLPPRFSFGTTTGMTFGKGSTAYAPPPGFASLSARALSSLVADPPNRSAVAPAPNAPAIMMSAPTAISPPSTASSATAQSTASHTAVLDPSQSVHAPRAVPASRPPTKAPVEAPPKKTGASKAAGKKEVAAKHASAVEATKAGVKPRGRPRKVVVVEDEASPVLANTTNATGAPSAEVVAASAEPLPISSITNNNGQRLRAEKAAAVKKAKAAEAEAEAALRAQAASGLMLLPNPNADTPTVVLTRMRKPTKLPDGTSVQMPTKGKRATVNPHEKTEAALLARSAAAAAGTASNAVGTKRKRVAGGENVAAPNAKKRKA
ncbi:hypothetical protein DFH09DRAFT_1324077 [Mycena vulgaris]|nr:hypothetical protein DFH09DRAFT_1324077 [Mycena vulgaris]